MARSDSLDALNEWYIRVAFEDQDDGMDWWPEWSDPAIRGREPSPLFEGRPVPEHLMRLWGLVAIYVGDVFLARDDDARWVCWRGTVRRESCNAKPLIDEGFREWPVDPIGIANAGVLRSYSYFGVGDDDDVPPDPAALRRSIEKRFTLNRDRRDSEERSWQRAPCGGGAGSRGPERPW